MYDKRIEECTDKELIAWESSLDYRYPDLIYAILTRAERYIDDIVDRFDTACENDDPITTDKIFDEAVEELLKHS